ncbi:MAG: glycosyl hydrolase [Terrimonas sp.]|nr:glycosyl hydrolase [Terrimonas sp.]
MRWENAICYSGYRSGQSPVIQVFPSYKQVKEDLLILKKNWKLIRLYDCTEHAETVLKVIRNEQLDIKVMLGAHLAAEQNNDRCPWGGIYPEYELELNRRANEDQVNRLIALSREYEKEIFCVSAGNEATVDWTDHLVPVEKVLGYVQKIKGNIDQPVTFCENYVPWQEKLKPLAAVVDFISLHTYPVWEYKQIGDALAYTIENYNSVAAVYPDKQVVITEAGWTTRSNGRGIHPENANHELQEIYYNALMEWSKQKGILTFVFEAFDEEWKGSDEPSEPEKHWGLFTVDRKPKKVMEKLYPELSKHS